MGYRISYGENVQKIEIQEKPAGKRSNKKYFLVAAIVAVLLAAWSFSDRLTEYLIPGDPEITRSAMTTMVAEIGSGESVGEAVTAFCKEIIAGAQVS